MVGCEPGVSGFCVLHFGVLVITGIEIATLGLTLLTCLFSPDVRFCRLSARSRNVFFLIRRLVGPNEMSGIGFLLYALSSSCICIVGRLSALNLQPSPYVPVRSNGYLVGKHDLLQRIRTTPYYSCSYVCAKSRCQHLGDLFSYLQLPPKSGKKLPGSLPS